MLDPHTLAETKDDKPKPLVIKSIFEIHKRDVIEHDEFGKSTGKILAHRGTQVFNQHGAPVYKTDNLYVRHLFDVTVHGTDGSFTHKEGDLFINSKGRAQEKPSSNPLPNVVFNGMRDGGPAMVSLQTHQDALRESRTVKNIARNLKHYKDRELLKLLDKVNSEVRKRGLVMQAGYQPVTEGEWTEPKNPPRGR